MSLSDTNKYGAIYSNSDYLGTWKRLGIIIIDFVFFSLISILIIMFDLIVQSIGNPNGVEQSIHPITIFVIIAAIIFYFPVLKATKIGTLGYRIFKAKLVTLNGKRISVLKSVLRFFFIVFGPINFIFDLIWMSGDYRKQGLRDKIVGTYVITNAATPIAKGIIRYPIYDILGLSFTFAEVEDKAT